MTAAPVSAGLLLAGILIDTLVGTLRAGLVSIPVVTLCAVAAIGVVTGARGGAIAGFAGGVVVDLLAGAASPGGLHALAGVAVGAAAGMVRPGGGGMRTRLSVAGAVLVTVGGVMTLALQQVRWPWHVAPRAIVLATVVAGSVLCPWLAALIVGALPRTPADDIGFR